MLRWDKLIFYTCYYDIGGISYLIFPDYVFCLIPSGLNLYVRLRKKSKKAKKKKEGTNE